MMPQADQSFGQISDLFGSIMTESGQVPAATATEIETGTGLNDEAMKIIEEASAIIEYNTKNKFPDLPFSDNNKEEIKSSSSSKRKQTSSLF